jgi:hypothetical protein
MRQRSPLEIIETVARKAGIELHQFEGALLSERLASAFAIGSVGPFRVAVCDPDFPPTIAFAGPFRVEVASFTEVGRYATGYLQLTALAMNLPVSVLYMLDGWEPVLPDPAVHSVDGRDLFHADRRNRLPIPLFHISRQTKSCTLQWQVPLRNLTADVTRIGSLRGSLPVLVPVKVDTGKIVLKGDHGSARIGPAELRWKRQVAQKPRGPFVPPDGPLAPTNNASIGLLMSLDERVPCRVCWMAIDAQGAGLDTGTLNLSGERYLTLPAGSQGLEIKTFTTEEIRYHFELTGIRNRNRPPARLVPLTFSGQSAPVSFAKPSIRGRIVTLELRNHTSKPVEEVRLRLRYLNRAGIELANEVVVHPAVVRKVDTPVLPETSTTTPFLGRRATTSIHPAVSLPDATSGVQVVVVRVLFADGTTWSPPER